MLAGAGVKQISQKRTGMHLWKERQLAYFRHMSTTPHYLEGTWSYRIRYKFSLDLRKMSPSSNYRSCLPVGRPHSIKNTQDNAT